MSAQTTKPPCTYHTDCFAHKDGRCNCLSKTDFVFRDCPFYKKKGTVEKGTNNFPNCGKVV